jgi:hypothetical protein
MVLNCLERNPVLDPDVATKPTSDNLQTFAKSVGADLDTTDSGEYILTLPDTSRQHPAVQIQFTNSERVSEKTTDSDFTAVRIQVMGASHPGTVTLTAPLKAVHMVQAVDDHQLLTALQSTSESDLSFCYHIYGPPAKITPGGIELPEEHDDSLLL